MINTQVGKKSLKLNKRLCLPEVRIDRGTFGGLGIESQRTAKMGRTFIRKPTSAIRSKTIA